VFRKEFVDFSFYEAAIKITWNAARGATDIKKETPESLDDAFCTLCLEAIYLGVTGAVIDEGEGVSVASGARAFTVPNVHADSVKSVERAFE
jgi:hypothetical protein